MNDPDKNRFAPLSIAEILVDVVMLFSALVIFAIILYILVPAGSINESIRNLYHLATLFFVAIISGIIYAKRHRKVFMKGELHFLAVILLLSFIATYLNFASAKEVLDLNKMLFIYWSGLASVLGPVILGAWTGGFIGSRIFSNPGLPGNENQ